MQNNKAIKSRKTAFAGNKMTKIYGVMECVTFQSLFHIMKVNESHPKLFEIVNNIKNSKVGIESFGSENYSKTKKGGIAIYSPKIY